MSLLFLALRPDVVDQDELAVLLATYDDPQLAADAMVDYALESDSRDNVTCIVADLVPARDAG